MKWQNGNIFQYIFPFWKTEIYCRFAISCYKHAPKNLLFLSQSYKYEETIFQTYFSNVVLCEFYKNPWIIAVLQSLPLNTVAHIRCVSGCFKSLWHSNYEVDRLWSGVNQTLCLKFMAPNHISLNRLIYRYPPREEPVQKEERSASILRHKFQKHLLTPQ